MCLREEATVPKLARAVRVCLVLKLLSIRTRVEIFYLLKGEHTSKREQRSLAGTLYMFGGSYSPSADSPAGSS